MGTETWYLLEDGSAGDPRDIAPDDKGVLRHKDGRPVAYAPHGPRSRSVDPDEERGKSRPKPKDKKPEQPKAEPEAKDMKPEAAKPGYKTRETKIE